jgi:prenyltransferase beta subunit
MSIRRLPGSPLVDTSLLERRDLLRLAAASLPLTFLGGLSFADDKPGSVLAESVVKFLATCRQANGGYGWGDQPRAHLTPTYGAVGCFHVLGVAPHEREALARYVRENHPFALKKLERELKSFEFQQIQSLTWLGESADSLRESVAAWTKPFRYAGQYEQHEYPVFEYETMGFTCRRLLGMSLADVTPELVAYLDSRRRDNGSFNNTSAADGTDGHLLNTWWGLRALDALGRADEKRDEVVSWVRACQRPWGGFSWQPKPFMADVEDVAYTWAALRILERLQASPARPDAVHDWLASLWNADGGFAGRPGWDSNPLTTYYALDALRALNALSQVQPPRTSRPARPKVELRDDWKVFTIQLEAHGQGSPAEAVDLARGLKIDLWGAKNAQPGWIEAAQQIARDGQTPVTFCVANEEYGTWVSLPGQGTYSHTSDLFAPAGSDIGPSLARAGVVDWEEFRERRLKPLEAGQGRLFWQFNENEAMTRLYLDDSLQRGGYAAICTFHFGNPDFTNSSPFLKLYRNQLPFVGMHDAHGTESWWWGDMLTGYRTLFVAAEPTWEGWLDALKHNRVVAVRCDGVSRGELWMHGGSPEVVEFIRRHEFDWRWWDNPHIERPLVSIVPLTPQSKFEVATPDAGHAIRVRCQWENTAQGLPKTPRAELKRLLIDDREAAAPERTVGRQGRITDRYHLAELPALAPGEHTATAVVQPLPRGAEVTRTIRFRVG